MALMEKYGDLKNLATELGLNSFQMQEKDGKLHIKGRTTYQLEKDLFWDALKKHSGWEGEVAADITAERDDVHGYHVVQPGDTLSKIAKVHLDSANRYMEIAKANNIANPDLIHPGQRLMIPKR